MSNNETTTVENPIKKGILEQLLEIDNDIYDLNDALKERKKERKVIEGAMKALCKEDAPTHSDYLAARQQEEELQAALDKEAAEQKAALEKEAAEKAAAEKAKAEKAEK